MEDNISPLVSVIIPFYNAPRLHIAIQSILNQTFRDFELILIDNSSNDGSSEVAKKYAIQNDRIKLLQERRRGVFWAMNKGIEVAKGKFIARMDADDYSFPERLICQLAEFEKNPSLGLISGLVEYEGDEKNEGFRLYVDWMNKIIDEADIYKSQFIEFPLANPSVMIRRELFKQVGPYREGDFPEDYEFFLRLQSIGVKMKKVKQKIIKWYDSPIRLTRTDPRYSTDAFYKIKARYLAKWLSDHNPFHPNILVWGAGRLSRRRSNYLLEYGISITQYIDLKKQEGVIHFKEIPDKNSCFIVSYVGSRGAREEIQQYLSMKHYREGIHFILAA